MARNAICIQDLEEIARGKLGKMVLEYFHDGSENGTAARENIDAFAEYKIRPRVLRDVSQIDSRASLLGTSTSFPLAIAPSGMQCLAHPDGEKATARAAARAGVGMAVSTFATTSLEDVKKAGDAVQVAHSPNYEIAYMLQLYVFRNRRTTEQLIRRAERAGYKAILLTCDTPRLGNRYNMTRNNFHMPPHLDLPNFGQQKVGPLIQRVVGEGPSPKEDEQVPEPKENENGAFQP